MNLNATRHKENSKYAHYSRINRKNYENYNIKKTNPIRFTMNKGDCLFIPKGWWHWIVSKPNTKAYNIWFDENIEIKKPVILSEKINSTRLTPNLFGCNVIFYYSEASLSATGRCLLNYRFFRDP